MGVLKVLTWPDKILETRAEAVIEFDDEFRSFVDDMHETMRASNGIGLASNQVGVLKRVLTVEIPFSNRYESDEDDDEPQVREWWHDKKFTFVNPVITKKSGKIKMQEGCLSFPEIYEFVDRSEEVWVDAQDEFGKNFQVHATGLFSVCLQHEIDHIDGLVFIERMSRLKASLIRKKINRRGRLEVNVES